uniref:Alpha-1,4 glucan phosphorylase n=1 Tax=Araucaria cunninghamii TaxID=56994 RepID=A0A0D6QZS8_ARACU
MALCGQSHVFIVQAEGSHRGIHTLRPRLRSANLAKLPCYSSSYSRSPLLSIRGVASEPKPKQASASEGEIPPLPKPAAVDSSSIASNIKYHAEFTPHFSPLKFELPQAFVATAESVRDSLIRGWNETQKHYDAVNPKQTYYLSMEFLQGRALLNAIGNLELTDAYAEALSKLGCNLESIAEQEPDAALGNGGLGRLASCFLDSLATLDYPAWGYGLRYQYGLFHQNITKDGQEEVAESWLEMGNPWEIARHDVSYPVKFYGKVENVRDGSRRWVGGEDIKVIAYDVPIPGYKTKTTLSLRLWSTQVQAEDFDLQDFNAGEHIKATEAQLNAAKICYVLYPGDDSTEGKILRLKQQYTLCSASLQDIISSFKRRSGHNVDWRQFPAKVAIQMNDTHPTLSILELIRILIDVEGLPWEEAWNITQRTLAYTNHTVLPEALEKWPFGLMQKLLPRHVEIVNKIDEEFIKEVIAKNSLTDLKELENKIRGMRILENEDFPESVVPVFADLWKAEEEAAKKVSEEDAKEESEEVDAKEESEEVDSEQNSKIKSEEEIKEPTSIVKPPILVRMANLCVIAGHAVNGVAEIHSEIVKDEVFNDFYQLWPEKFQNKTNGVTPRRWIRFCNPELSKIITKWLGTEDWILQTERLAELRKFADNKDLHKEWRAAKRANKLKLVSYIKEKTGYIINPDSMFDIQVKRIHEYKRQLMNILGVVYRYKKMKEMTPEERKAKFAPRVCIFGGKAFATYVQAKRIVKLITDVGVTINHDTEIGDLLKVIFVPDYNVSVAEMLIPASELSQHISTAGMEASGTSNMKFSMNGCILIGTLDGANVEIREEVGEDNFFLFGARANEIAGLRKDRAEGKFKPDPRFEEAKDFIKSGVFGKYDYNPLLDSLEGTEGYGRGDYFLVGKDFPSYIECQEKVDEMYKDQEIWTRMSILNTAGSYKFSSDRTIHEYAKDIWEINPVKLP